MKKAGAKKEITEWEREAWKADAAAQALDALMQEVDAVVLQLRTGEVSVSALRALVLQVREHLRKSVRMRPKPHP